jgi:signal transduction histidine kinase
VSERIPPERLRASNSDRERVLQIGGRIEIQSSTGEGTTVRVELPVPVAVHREYTEDSGAEPDE